MVKIVDAQSTSQIRSTQAELRSPNGPAPEGPGELYTAKAGDTLKALAEEFLGDEELWTEIARANPQIKNGGPIFAGDQVRIPQLDDAFYAQLVDQRTGMGDTQQQVANFVSNNQQAALVDKKQTGTLELLQQKKQLEQDGVPKSHTPPAATPPPLAQPSHAETVTRQPPAVDVSTAPGRLQKLLQDNPQLKTNQDFINYCYRHGDNNWGGASKVADRFGKDLNDLVQDRSGAIRPDAANNSRNPEPTTRRPEARPEPRPETPAPTTRTPSAPVTNPNARGAALETFPIAGGRYNIGYDRDWNNFDASSASHNSDFSHNPTDANHPTGHQGVDIFAPRGQPVVSPVTGVVERAGHTSVGGNCVTIRRGEERFYLAHLDSLENLRPGQAIHAGDPVGTVGNSGNAQGTAPHLHFSIYKGAGGYSSHAINPFPHLMAVR